MDSTKLDRASRPQNRTELPLWQVLSPRKVMRAGGAVIALAAGSLFMAEKIKGVSNQDKLDKQLSQPISTVNRELADGQINKNTVTVIRTDKGYQTAWAAAESLTHQSVDPQEPSDIIVAQTGGSPVTPGEELVLPRDDNASN